MWGTLLKWGGRALRFGAKVAPYASFASGVKNNIAPSLEDEVTVEVIGQPGATKRQLYYLAMAAAFGLVKRYDIAQWAGPPPGLLMIEYDASDHWVRVTLKYKTSMLSSAIANLDVDWTEALADVLTLGLYGIYSESKDLTEYFTGRQSQLPPDKWWSDLPVYAGPSDGLVGGEFNFTGDFAIGVPGKAQYDRNAPKLPFANRVILTPSGTIDEGLIKPSTVNKPTATGPVIPSPNPLPPGDHRSRGAIVEKASNQDNGLSGTGLYPDPVAKLIPMIFAALSTPGSSDRAVYQDPAPGVNGR